MPNVSACGNESAEIPEREDPPEPPQALERWTEPSVPPYPIFEPQNVFRAPPAYDHLLPHLGDPDAVRFANLYHMASNRQMRGPRSESGSYQRSGREIAQGWRQAAASVKGIFAHRDGLFSQQDHPIDQGVIRIMMPPSWVSVAVDATIRSRPLEDVRAPPLDDDRAWTSIASARELFGSFPPSDSLFRAATQRLGVIAEDRLRVTSARRSITMLARDVQAMVDVADQGAEAVAAAGAERIAMSDLQYFGTRVRREHMILIMTDNPSIHELRDEGRGFDVYGRDLTEEAIEMARRAVIQRRMRDGDVAIERYNISLGPERRRSIRTLTRLLDGAPREATLWLFAHGGIDPDGGGQRDAFPFANGYRSELEEAGLRDRVRLVSVPAVPIGGRGLHERLHEASRRYRAVRLPLHLNLGTPLTKRLLDRLQRE